MSKLFEALQKTGHAIPEAEVLLFDSISVNPSIEPNSSGNAPDSEKQAENSLIKPHLEAVQTAVTPKVTKPTSSSQAGMNADHTVETADRLAPTRTISMHLIADYPVLPFDARSRRSVEQYRLIRTKLHHHPAKPKIVLMTSAGPGDGKTVTSINLAGAMSLKAGARVLLVEGDLRRPSVARMLGLPSQPGLTDVISQVCNLTDALIHIEQFPNLFVLASGTPSQNPPELLDSPNWHALCASLRERFQYVILDSPPVGSVADYFLLEEAADGVVMIVRPDHTKRATFKKAIATIPSEKLLGVIVNDVEDWFLWTVQAGQSYAYYDSLDMTQERTVS